MNLCQFGIHDWEELDVDYYKLVRQTALKDFYYSHGCYAKDGIRIDLEEVRKIIPANPAKHICLKCGKINIDYDLEKICKKIDKLIEKTSKEKHSRISRQEKAKQLAALFEGGSDDLQT